MSELIDNRAQRIRDLKRIIRHLHAGGAPDEVRQQLRDMVRETDASEIAAMEQELIAEGMPVEEVQSMCDLHSQVMRSVLTKRREPDVPPGHPVDTLRRENAALGEVVARMRRGLEALQGAADDAAAAREALLGLRAALNELMDVEKHYQRKENLFFSCLERHGITGPSKVMWGKDDEVRSLLRGLEEILRAAEPAQAQAVVRTADLALGAVEEMIFKEDEILVPMALGALTEDEWGEIWAQSPPYGWCLVEPREGYAPPRAADAPPAAAVPSDHAFTFPTGALTPAQLRGVFAALPVDLTFVDAEDRVRYFTEGPEPVFARSKAILGRKVQHCHPPTSVGVVEQILDDFRSGRQDVAEFWITFQGKFVHIRYFAVRDGEGAYLGTMEVTQDATRLRALEGERRLLTYEGSA